MAVVFSLGITLVAGLPLGAALLSNVPQTLVQPDGQVLHCYASGDEFYHWLHDENGYVITKDPNTGYFVYMAKINNQLMPTGCIPGRVDPRASNLQKGIGISKSELQQRLAAFSSRMPGRSLTAVPAPTTGTINNIVIFIRFSDEFEFTDPISGYNSMFNSATAGFNSMYNYFKEASYNALSTSTTFYPAAVGGIVRSYQDLLPRGYYQPYDYFTNPIGYSGDTELTNREMTLLKNAVDAVSPGIPGGLNVDADSDGKVDNVCFVVYGSPDGWGDLLWPHMWELFQTAYINSKQVRTFNFQLQTSLASSGNGVLCHEMFHSLGAPDLYHYVDNGIEPVYTWDLMEYNQNPPQHMGAYMKYRYGNWIASIPEITSSGTYTLNPLTSSTNNCYKIKSPNSTAQYFVLEYRRATGAFEGSLWGSGLLVYRINSAEDGNGNQNGPPDEVYIYRLNGTTTVNGSPWLAHFSSGVGRTAINDGTNPSSFLSSGNAGGLSISSIGSAGSTISFQVTLLSLSKPTLSPDGGTHTSSKNVTISCATSGATIRYTTTGVDPTTSSSTIASGGTVTVNRNLTLKAKAWKTGLSASAVKSATYTILVATPTFSSSSGTYIAPKNVAISCATSGATIRYTTTGVDPTTGSSTIASGGAVTLRRNTTLKAKAWKTNLNNSAVKSAVYTLYRRAHFDVNGDGSDDLAGISSSKKIYYSINKSTWINIKGALASLTVGSYNGDGADDIAGISPSGKVYYTTNKSTWKNISGTFNVMASGDFNGDGIDDFAVRNSGGLVYYCTNKSTWTNIPGALVKLTTGDYNCDGTYDIAGISSTGKVYYTLNKSTWTNIPGSFNTIVSGDFNGDGVDDIAVRNSAGKVYYTTNKSTWTNIPGALIKLTVGDYNGDKKCDIAGISSSGKVYYTTNKSTWTGIPGTFSSIVSGDFNGNDIDDLAVRNSVGKIYYTVNKSTWINIPGTLSSLYSAK